MAPCKIIAITNQKGGVGKTTTTVNLGVGLAKEGKRVLFVDADPQGSLTVSMGIKNPDELSVTLSAVMQSVMQDQSVASGEGIINHNEGVDLMPSNIELSGMEVSLFNTMSREYVLKNYLDMVKQDYDYILIDCMPSLGMMTINALTAADRVIIPCQPNFLSAKGLNLLLHSVSRVKKRINPDLQIDGILLTMVDQRTNNAKSVIASLREGIALYINTYGELPPNFITKNEARDLGWEGGSLEPYAPGMCIGGNYFGNFEGLLPDAEGREYTECDINTMGADSRGPERIVFSNDGLIYYTPDHYESFELLYGEE